jgi:hypothetical protein
VGAKRLRAASGDVATLSVDQKELPVRVAPILFLLTEPHPTIPEAQQLFLEDGSMVLWTREQALAAGEPG